MTPPPTPNPAAGTVMTFFHFSIYDPWPPLPIPKGHQKMVLKISQKI